jgi:hypothetical protein
MSKAMSSVRHYVWRPFSKFGHIQVLCLFCGVHCTWAAETFPVLCHHYTLQHCSHKSSM